MSTLQGIVAIGDTYFKVNLWHNGNLIDLQVNLLLVILCVLLTSADKYDQSCLKCNFYIMANLSIKTSTACLDSTVKQRPANKDKYIYLFLARPLQTVLIVQKCWSNLQCWINNSVCTGVKFKTKWSNLKHFIIHWMASCHMVCPILCNFSNTSSECWQWVEELDNRD